MNLPRNLLASISVLVFSVVGHTMGPEEFRLRGFAEHQKENEQFDRARQRGERAYYERLDQWETVRKRNLDQYKKEKKENKMTEESPEALADAAVKQAYEEQRLQSYRDYQAQQKAEVVDREKKNLPSEAEELGIDKQRPRYDYKKRALYGGEPKYRRESMGTSFGGRDSSGGTSFGDGNYDSGTVDFPPPPDDFGDGGYVPPPVVDEFGDAPPPPPYDETYGNGEYENFPPPPPPPPPFDESGGDF